MLANDLRQLPAALPWDVPAYLLLDGISVEALPQREPDGTVVWHSGGPTHAQEPEIKAGLARALQLNSTERVGPWTDSSGQLRLAFLAPVAADSGTPASNRHGIRAVAIRRWAAMNMNGGWRRPETVEQASMFTKALGPVNAAYTKKHASREAGAALS